MVKTNSINPIIPFKFYAGREKEMLAEMLKLKRESVLRRFSLIELGWGTFDDIKIIFFLNRY